MKRFVNIHMKKIIMYVLIITLVVQPFLLLTNSDIYAYNNENKESEITMKPLINLSKIEEIKNKVKSKNFKEEPKNKISKNILKENVLKENTIVKEEKAIDKNIEKKATVEKKTRELQSTPSVTPDINVDDIQKINIKSSKMVKKASKTTDNAVSNKTSSNPSNIFNMTAEEVVKEMGLGWNLGCSLESFNQNAQVKTPNVYNKNKSTSNKIAIENYDKNYQIMAVYTDEKSSGWDASPTPKMGSDNTIRLLWEISKLNSKLSNKCSTFSIQLINNSLVNSNNKNVKYSITNVSFITSSGKVVDFDSYEKEYVTKINKGVGSYIHIDISNNSILKTTQDILGGVFQLTVKITEFPDKTVAYENVSSSDTYANLDMELIWGNPATTKSLIAAIKDAGFSSVRIPVTYFNHIDNNGEISKKWLNRVEEVVKCVLDNDMYCIINAHHDTGEHGWLKADANSYNQMSELLKGIWVQIANQFKNYDGRLLFEGFNEILNSKNQWSYAGSSSYETVNKLNQDFVSVVRGTGGNNSKRFLVTNVYATNTDQDILNAFRIPRDDIKNHLIAQVHIYSGDYVNILNRVYNTLVKKGIPVIVGEMGTTTGYTYSKRIAMAKEMVSLAKSYGIACFWWDDGGTIADPSKVYNYALINRWNLKWHFPELVEAMVNASKK